MAKTIRIPNNWQPRPYQLRAWSYLEAGGKRAVLPWHRRAGKDDLSLHFTATAALQRPGTYWHMLPAYAQARKAIWQAVNPHTGKRRIDEAFPAPIRARPPNNQDMHIELVNGSWWHLVGSDNYNSLVGSPPAGVVFSEWALADPASWAYLRPILDENQGWAIWIYTPRGRNHGASMYQLAQRTDGWYAELLRAEDTGIFQPEQLDQAREEMRALYGVSVGDMLFEQEYNCSFQGGLLGAYYVREIEDIERKGQVCNVEYQSELPVETWWDLGMRDAMAIWFVQRAGQEIHVIDYYEATGERLEHYAKVLQERGYVYGKHYAPHDVTVRELGAGSRLEVARSLGIDFQVVPRHSPQSGIDQCRRVLPRCWFDSKKTERGLNCLQNYRAKYDDERKLLSSTPIHDWTSHGADAFRTGCMAQAEYSSDGWEPIEYPNYGIL